MTSIVSHRFVSAKAVGSDGTQVQSTNWNDGHQLTGGNNGSLLVRDTSDASFGSNWLQSTTAGLIVQAQGSGIQPAYSAYGIPTANPTVGDIWAAASSVLFSAVTAVASGAVFVSKGAGVLPAWSSSLSITNLNLAGTITAVNGVTSAGNGASFPVAITTLTAQGADVALTNLLAAAPSGLYRVSVWNAVTRVGTTNSVLPGVRIRWNNGTAQALLITASTSGNALTTFGQASAVMKSSSSATPAITYETTGFSTTGATSMQYETYISLEAIY